MTVNYTTLLGLAQPVTGTEANTWGDVVNDEITALIEEAVAGGETIDVTAGNVTLTDTAGVANQARNAILLITGTPGVSRNVVAPSASKVYIIKNGSDAAVVLKGSATTGVTIPVGVEALCFWNGSDFEIVGVNGPASSTDNAVVRFDSTTGKVIQNSGVTIDDSNVMGGITQLNVDNLRLDGNAITSTNTDGNIDLTPNGTGEVNISKVDIDSGAIDGTTIGANSAAAGTFTTATATTGNITTVNATTVDATNIEVTNIKAKDGTASVSIADSTGIPTISKATVIETTDNTNAALRITQLGTGNALLVEDSANPDSSPFVIDASGKTLLGLTTAKTTGIGSASLQIAGGTAPLSFIREADSSTAINLEFSKARASGAILVSGDTIGRLYFSGSDGTAQIPAAFIDAAVDGTPGTNDMPGRLVFSTTADGASSTTERMRIRSDGGIGIGATGSTASRVNVSGNMTGGTSAFGILNNPTIQSDVTSAAHIYRTGIATAASSFTLSTLNHYQALQGTFGAGSTVTNQVGFVAESSLTGATNNYGFYSNIASGTGRWNFYANGTADNYFAGNVGIGTSSGTWKTTIVNGSVPRCLQISQLTTNNADKYSFISAGHYTNTTYTDGFALIGGVGTAANNAVQIGGGIGESLASSLIQFYTAANTTTTAGTERMRIDSSGNLLVGATSFPNYGTLNSYSNSGLPAGRFLGGPSMSDGTAVAAFDKNSATTTTSQNFVVFTISAQTVGSGQINANGASQAAFGTFSDRRLKENIVDLEPQLANICALRPVEFDYIESEGGGHQISFIAQEFEEVYPDAIGERSDGMKTLTGWDKTTARLVKAIQELKAELDTVKAELATLKGN